MGTEKKKATGEQIPGGRGGTLTKMRKGETLNPNGRPKSARYLTEMLKEALESDAEILIEGIAEADAKAGEKVKIRVKMPTHLQIIQALLRKAAKGDNKAIEMVLDRVEGRVPLPIGSDPNAPLLPEGSILNLTPAQAQKVIDSL